jgi:hypothetical protein
VRRDQARAVADEVGEHLAVRRHHHRAVRHPQLQIGAVRAVPVAALTLLAVAGAGMRPVVKVEKGVHTRVHGQHHIAAAAAVAAVRAAQRLELLAVHGRAAVTPVAGGDVDRHPVDKAGHGPFLSWRSFPSDDVTFPQ